MCMCIYVYMYVCVNRQICVYMYICNVYIYMCIHVYMQCTGWEDQSQEVTYWADVCRIGKCFLVVVLFVCSPLNVGLVLLPKSIFLSILFSNR